MDSGSLYHFCHDCRIGNFGRFISTLHTVSHWLLLIEHGEMTDADNGMNPLNFDIDLAADQSGFKSRIFWMMNSTYKESGAYGIGKGIHCLNVVEYFDLLLHS